MFWLELWIAPYQVSAYWQVDGQRIPYARFLLERLEYDPMAVF